MVHNRVKETETFEDQIAKATLRLVAERGTDQIHTSDVVKAMGVTRAAIARHCPTEDDLWLVVADLMERRMNQAWSATTKVETSPLMRLRSLLTVQTSLILEAPALRALLLSGSLHEDSAALRRGLCGIRQGFKDLLINILIDGQREGQFCKDLEADATADRIVEAIQGMIISMSLDQEESDPVDAVWLRLDALLSVTRDCPQVRSVAGN